MKIELKAIEKIPLIEYDDNISDIIMKYDLDIQDNDIYIIASTIIAKSQGQSFLLNEINPSNRAIEISKKTNKDPRFIESIIQSSSEILIDKPFILSKTKNGNICINAGIDGSNVKGDYYIKLPSNPDKEAEKIGKEIFNNINKKVSIIISDTNGRPFRKGQTGVAIGVFGIKPIYSWIGKKDLFNYTLQISEEAIIDEIASAANILMGEGNNGYPIIKLRGLNIYTDEKVSISTLYREEDKDLIVNLIKKSNN